MIYDFVRIDGIQSSNNFNQYILYKIINVFLNVISSDINSSNQSINCKTNIIFIVKNKIK